MIETIPCSHVGHIFHNQVASGEPSFGREMLRNDVALAHMWLDEYKEMHFQKMGIESMPPVRQLLKYFCVKLMLYD